MIDGELHAIVVLEVANALQVHHQLKVPHDLEVPHYLHVLPSLRLMVRSAAAAARGHSVHASVQPSDMFRPCLRKKISFSRQDLFMI